MKRIALILVLTSLLLSLSAVKFDLSGESRIRGAIMNDAYKYDGDYIDSRTQLRLDSQFHQNLKFHIEAQIGDMIWGNGGGSIGGGEIVRINEANFDYRFDKWDANLKVGLMYWADRQSLFMDDYFAGILFSKEYGDNLSTEFAYIKSAEHGITGDDDAGMIVLHGMQDGDMPFGGYVMVGYDRLSSSTNIALMPYLNLSLDPIDIDITAFLDVQTQSGSENQVGFGGAVKADMNIEQFEVGADLLLATENGLSVISPYYKNGLYIYGFGEHHDGLSLYWYAPYSGNSDFFMSLVGKMRMPLQEKMNVFANAGFLTKTGFEVNAGLEYELIPDLLDLAAYGAFGVHENKTKNYAFGTTLKLEF